MSKVKGFILTIFGIPLLLFGMLILIGLTWAGIIGMAFIIPGIIFATILLLIGAFLIFLGLREYIKNKRISGFNDMYGNSHVDNYEFNKGIGNKAKIQYTLLVIVLVLVTMVIILTMQPWDQTLSISKIEVSDSKERNINSVSPLTNGTLIVANDGNVFNSTNPTITVDSSTPSKFVIYNQDSTFHDFHIDSMGIHSPVLKEGDSYEFIVQDIEPGVYEYLCAIHPNKMRGIWTVNDGAIAG
jgi:plastocyanin